MVLILLLPIKNFMSDHLNNKFPQDPTWITTSEEGEIQYWTVKFNCTKEELIDAISKVGNYAETVKYFLKRSS